MMKLYQIEPLYLQVLEEIEEAEGVLTPELEQKLAIQEDTMEHAVVQYKEVMDILQNNMDLADKEIARIQKFKQVKENAYNRFKEELLRALLLFGEEDKKGIKRLEFGTLRLSTRRNSFVDVYNEESLDKKFLKIDVSNLSTEQFNALVSQFPELAESAKEKVSKTEIKEAIKGGEAVDGAEIRTSYSLNIR